MKAFNLKHLVLGVSGIEMHSGQWHIYAASFFIYIFFYYGTHRPYSFILLFLFFTMALIGHTHLFRFFYLIFFVV